MAVTAAAFLIYEVVAYRAELKENVGTLTRVVARNSTAALAFRSEKDANDVLSALEAEPQIVAAALYTADGRLFARYPKNASPDRFPKGPQHAERRFENGHLIVFDTARADAFEPHGGPAGSTPAFADLARRGTAVESVHAAACPPARDSARQRVAMIPKDP